MEPGAVPSFSVFGEAAPFHCCIIFHHRPISVLRFGGFASVFPYKRCCCEPHGLPSVSERVSASPWKRGLGLGWGAFSRVGVCSHGRGQGLGGRRDGGCRSLTHSSIHSLLQCPRSQSLSAGHQCVSEPPPQAGS
ncbi:hypothetical protein HJG60_008966 [Phyllostomus discolor]|uniref:Uncharacterized protein n=1 Tax=Phyllostomus discolor TaxID=89673 RepID=A0A833YWS6_9CHIR|nr:hypothetical protein HJG60_008966 [Phyllostomus discolor]